MATYVGSPYNEAAYRKARAAFIANAEPVCAICGASVDKALSGRSRWGPTVGHTQATSRGGDMWDTANWQLTHKKCNESKGDGAVRRRSRSFVDAGRTSNVDALACTLAALTVRPEYAALATAARTLAQAVDVSPEDAQLWREYRTVLSDLVEVGTDVDKSDEAAFGAAVRTPLRDASVA